MIACNTSHNHEEGRKHESVRFCHDSPGQSELKGVLKATNSCHFIHSSRIGRDISISGRCNTTFATILLHLLSQRLTLRVCRLHDVVNTIDRLAVLECLGHLCEHSLQLIWEPLMEVSLER